MRGEKDRSPEIWSNFPICALERVFQLRKQREQKQFELSEQLPKNCACVHTFLSIVHHRCWKSYVRSLEFIMRLFIVNIMIVVILVAFTSANHEHENELDDGEQFVVRPLNTKNYQHILDTHKIVFVKFFVRWCKYWWVELEVDWLEWSCRCNHLKIYSSNVTVAASACSTHGKKLASIIRTRRVSSSLNSIVSRQRTRRFVTSSRWENILVSSCSRMARRMSDTWIISRKKE